MKLNLFGSRAELRVAHPHLSRRFELEDQLLTNAKERLPRLDQILMEDEKWGLEDFVYRYYHGSGKAYSAERRTIRIVEELQAILPGRPLHESFTQLIPDPQPPPAEPPTFPTFDEQRARRAIEAYLHALYFLQMLAKYARHFDAPPGGNMREPFPSGWAAIRILYQVDGLTPADSQDSDSA